MTETNADNAQIKWFIKVPLLTNRFIMADFLKLVLLSPAISALLVFVMLLIVNDMPFLEMVKFCGVVFVVGFVALSVLLVLVMLLFYFNRFPMTFTVHPQKGVLVEVTNTQRKLNNLTVIFGILAGRPGVAGAGLMAQSQEAMGMRWEDVYHIDYFPDEHVISLKNTWRTVLRLYCTSENYDAVADMCQQGFVASEGRRAINTRENQEFMAELKGQFRMSVGWIVLALASAVLLSESVLIEEKAIIGVACVSLLASLLIAGAARRFFGVIALVASIALAVIYISRGLQVTSDLFGLSRFSGFNYAITQTGLAGFILITSGLACLTLLSLRSALAQGDLGKSINFSKTNSNLLIAGILLAIAAVPVTAFVHQKLSQTPRDSSGAFVYELQQTEIHSWDTPGIKRLKQAFNSLVECVKASPDYRANKAAPTLPESCSGELEAFQTVSGLINTSGSDIEKLDARILNQALKLWLKNDKISDLP